jgi:pantetheine-phosphate adenylyltransferase
MAHSNSAVLPGSFDPLTFGHSDIIVRSLKIFEKVTVAVVANPNKKTLFTLDERVDLIRQEFASHSKHLNVTSFSGLLVEFVKSVDSRVIIRGLRAISDFDYEAQMALVNRNLCSEIETFFLTTREEHSYISSSIVKQVALLGGSVSAMVPPLVEAALQKKLKEQNKKP